MVDIEGELTILPGLRELETTAVWWSMDSISFKLTMSTVALVGTIIMKQLQIIRQNNRQCSSLPVW